MIKVKNQLNDFETNFDLNDERGLTLVFLNPVLLTNDVIWLMKGGPVSVEMIDEGEFVDLCLSEAAYSAPGGRGCL